MNYRAERKKPALRDEGVEVLVEEQGQRGQEGGVSAQINFLFRKIREDFRKNPPNGLINLL